MIRKAPFVIAALAACLSPFAAMAQLVFISGGGGDEEANGRGIAVPANGRCHVLAPAHVVNAINDITVTGRGRVSSKASVVKDFSSDRGTSLDLAILELPADSKFRCDEALPTPKAITDKLEAANLTTVFVRRIDAKGAPSLGEARVRFVEPADIRITPGSQVDDALYQGDSGSIVYAGDIPVAMLVSRSGDDSGRYSAIRLDFALPLINDYFASQRAPVRAFQFTRFTLDQPQTAMPGGNRGDNSRLLLTPEELRAETDRLLAGTKGFPQIDNNASADQLSVAGDLTVTAVALETGVRNNCSRKNTKLLGMSVPTYEARDASAVCHNGFGPVRTLMRFTFRLSGQVREGTGGAVAPILDQFQLVLPADSGQANLMLATELSYRICARTSAAVAQLTPGTKTKAKPLLGSGGLFGNANLIVPNLENPKLRTGC